MVFEIIESFQRNNREKKIKFIGEERPWDFRMDIGLRGNKQVIFVFDPILFKIFGL